ncbi:hypothetical protein CMK12_11370 [Candidatus Poribacteria bacterium]|jgi:hypothetical protein|nr:hypothetical protein [Candidatus Poribacteria bacterium]MDP6595227.1 twin-arginine translocation signal domain-containing protein [Candidatus Poribacteria bacterium]MDP6749657.1 twin-arginine translocation signal domain-containing protein [Candidatus Poribacteria bacterium]MDP6995982.1 twin-arginine translocation signal domain-containing protein [Candidatus Poribacteria bacterium]
MAEDKDKASGLSRRKFLQGIGTGAVVASVAPTQLASANLISVTDELK